MTLKELKFALVSGREVVIEKGHINTPGTVIAVTLQVERDMVVPYAEVKTMYGTDEKSTLSRLRFKDPTDIEKLVDFCDKSVDKIHF